MVEETAVPVPDNYIVLEWGDGEYQFRLPIGQIGELQTKCGAGIGKIFARLMAGRFIDRDNGDIVLNPLLAEFRYEDVLEVIRLGLIGGNHGIVNGEQIAVTPTKALQLVREYVHARPVMENWRVASAILNAFLIGYSDPDKASSAEKKRPVPKTPKAGSTST
jgi:hypothetical protein